MHSNLISSISRIVISKTGAFCVALSLCTLAHAQITAPAGSPPQETRAAPMGTQAQTPASNTVESNTPQAHEAKREQRGNVKSKAARKPEGAGGFDNGLYGTGAGNNK
ncbi:hypothetical protein PPMP20_28365 [Paraburkholderia phymatum]|uniref:Lipoprotein n=1 Tax=Paraburkholderia phymatum (strain DSM 17167 / CIP 108236 / LMG 21445 / STM815) TaxID=391038 RepID=B2JN90_PARP8|nr:hypothetical protein [Paraburkholderia phymatum]ACC72938.1 hypothetical protein Bphy_3807 [Paraburkholderia phymatum STM815]